jgi:hypothetical protein
MSAILFLRGIASSLREARNLLLCRGEFQRAPSAAGPSSSYGSSRAGAGQQSLNRCSKIARAPPGVHTIVYVTLRAVVAALVLLSLPAPRARATECRAIDGGVPALAQVDAEARLRWLDHRLSIDARNARIWAITWGLGYGTISAVEFGLIWTTHDTGQRAEYVVGAVASFIGVMAIGVLPLSIMNDQRWWERHEARAPKGTDVCALLSEAERVLIRGAASEAFGVGPLVHIGNFAINTAAGLVLGLGYGRWSAFAYTGIVGIAVGELQVATQPTGVIEDLRRYRNAELGDAPARAAKLQWSLTPYASRDGGGARFVLAF